MWAYAPTVPRSVGHGKKGAWATWKVLPQLTEALLALTKAPNEIPPNAFHSIERFVILLYDRTSTCTNVNIARRNILARKNDVKQIPPTSAFLEQHGTTAITYITFTNQLGLDQADKGLYEPLWTTLAEASKACYEFETCKCIKSCVKRCKCKAASLGNHKIQESEF